MVDSSQVLPRETATADVDWSGLRALIEQAERNGCVVGVSVSGPGGSVFEHRADQRFLAASTVKIPVMIEVYRAVDNGSLALDEPYVLRAADKVAGSGVLLHLHDGLSLMIGDLIYLMISISDNTATNALIGLVGMETIGQTMRELGMSGSTLRRLMMGAAANDPERENWATPRDYRLVLSAILEGRAASAHSCEAMLGMLEQQQCTTRIARFLPPDGSVRWGSKTGGLPGIVSDVGFIHSEHGTLLLGLYCAGIPDQHVGEELLGKLAWAAMQATGVAGVASAS